MKPQHKRFAPPIQRRDAAMTHLPASFAQQRLWFLDQLEPGTTAYNIPLGVRWSGPMDIAIFERCVLEIVSRHESLRTTFKNIDGQPVQVISPPATLSLPVVDLSKLSEAEREREVARERRLEVQTSFDLAEGPLWRVKVLRLAAQEHILLFTMHHAISDGWSRTVVVREMAALYKAFATGRPSPLEPLTVQYADYAIWQREWLQGDALEAQVDYWRKQLAGAPSRLELPTDRPHTRTDTRAAAFQSFRIPREIVAKLVEIGRREEATLFMVLLAAFSALLARYSGQNDVLVGTAIAGRPRAELEKLIGFFVNTVVIRADLSERPSFRELLKRVRTAVLDAYAHQDLPFEKLVEELQPERSLGQSPFFQAMMVMQNLPRGKVAMDGLQLEWLEVEELSAQFDLTFVAGEVEQGVQVTFVFSTDVFESATIERLLGHFKTLVESIVAAPQRGVHDHALLPAAEKRRLLVEWNETATDYPREKTIHGLLAAQAAATPSAIAVEYEGARLSYGELDRRANQLAHYLRRRGVGPEVRVGLCVERSLEMVVGLLGILKAGGAYVPLDRDYPLERLNFMIADAQLSVLVTAEKTRAALPALEGQVISLDGESREIGAESEAEVESGVTAANLAYVIYTSGSTGIPKGVQIPHRAVVNFLCFMQKQLGITAQDVLLSVTSLSFDIAVLELYLPLMVGARVVLATRAETMDAALLSARLETSGASLMQATPATWRMLTEFGWRAPRTLKILCGGEALSRELAQRLAQSGSELWNLYGPTETTVWSLTKLIKACETRVTIGHPLANTQVYVLDQQQQPVPVGVAGELYLGGEGLARGYLQRPALTAERFVPDAFSNVRGARLYRTGDLVRYLANGELDYLGRLDQQVKVRGFRIELGEIEATLSTHSAVRECLVTANEVAPGDMRLVAYVVNPDEAPASEELRQHLKDRLPEYMVPSFFVTLEELPRLPNGKIDRRGLPLPSQPQSAREFVAPRNEIETEVANIWAGLLRVERVGIHDNFFELGGHSLLATQVISRIRAALGVEVSLRRLFESPTVAGLAVAVVQEQASDVDDDEMGQIMAELEYLSDDDALSQVSS